MGGPGNRRKGQELAPFYILKVEGTELKADVTNFIQSVEFESATDMLDILKIQTFNPGFLFDLGGPDFTTHKVWQPGNAVDVWVGYGGKADAVYLGRGIVDKHLPRYPENAIPIMEIVAYDGAKRMSQESTEITTGDRHRRRSPNTDNAGWAYVSKTHSEMVEIVAQRYGFGEDVYPTDKVDTIVQKKDMKDLDFVKGLAAIDSMDFWVDYNIKNKQWVLHWLPRDYTTRPEYVLDYGSDTSAIFRCEAEYGLSDQITDLQVMYFSERLQSWQRVDKIITVPGPDNRFKKSGATSTTQTPRRRRRRGRKPVKAAQRQVNLVQEEIKAVGALRLAAGGHSIDVVPNRRFKDGADAIAFAKRWLQRRREHFIILKGECVGLETLRARQVHKIKGLGKRLSGDYFFTSVRHKLGGGQQYRCEFQAHKVLEDEAT